MRKKVLIIDDDVTNGNLLRMFLEMAGYAVELGFDFDEGKAALNGSVDMLIADFHLPQNRSGVDLLTAVRHGETEQPKTTPVIISSGDDRVKAKAEEAAADAFLLKPFTPDDLIAVMENVLAGGSA